MAIDTTLIACEENLAGNVVNASLSATGLTLYVRFYDTKTGVARTPQATTLMFTLDKDNDRFEIVKADSHSTTSGVTTITINASGRAIPLYGTGGGGATGNIHDIGAQVGSVILARPLNELAAKAVAKAGDTFTGPVNFSGATTTFQLPNLTEVERDALASPANGMKIYNTTAGEEQVYNGGGWYAVSAGSTQPNMSTTVAGKGEAATDSEALAGTTTGGTGALTVITGGNKVLPIRDFVLSDTVSARSLVKITNDAGTGKAAPAVSSTSSAEFSEPLSVSGNTLYAVDSLYIPDLKKTVILFTDQGAAPGLSMVIYSEPTGSVEEFTLVAAAVAQMHLAYDSVNKAVVVTYCISATSISSIVVNLKGSAWITAAVEVDTTTNTKHNLVYDSTSGKMLCVFGNSADSQKLYSRVGTVASGTITWGAATKVSDDTVSATTGAIEAADYPDESGCYVFNNSGGNVVARICTISGTTPSFAAAQTAWTGGTLYSVNATYGQNYSDTVTVGSTMVLSGLNSSDTKPYAVAMTSTGGTLTAGSPVKLLDAAGGGGTYRLDYFPTTGLYAACFYSTTGVIYTFSVSGTTVSGSTLAATMTSGADPYGASFDIFRERMVVVIRTGATDSDIKQVKLPGDYSSMDIIHGVAQAAGVATDTVAITMPGCTVEGFTGQTPGATAYALGETIQTTYVTRNKVGQFLSATELYFDPKQIN